MTKRIDPSRDSRHNLKSHCPKGHPYDEANTRYRKSGVRAGNRYCGECNRQTNLRGFRRRWAADPDKCRRVAKAGVQRWMANPANRLKMKVKRAAWHSRNSTWANVRTQLHKYNLTLDQYHAIYERDDFVCYICQTDERRLGIDHDHATGRVRHVLCNGCNAGIGNFRENPALLRAAAVYAETQC